MADFSVRSDSVNVEQIMEQIRSRIREKRGVDYTEQQIRELAAVKLEKFLDPRGVRSDLLDQFRKAQPAYEPPELPNFAFEDATLFESHRAPIQWLRKLLLPILKLFFNPNPLIQALHIQARLNTMNAEREARREAARRQLDQLYYELIHNLVLETTRLGIDVKNLKMRLESVSSRLEFNERRARALESVVVYKPSSGDEERPPRQERGERGDRSERGDRGDRGDRSDRGDRNDRGDRSDRGERERGERSGRQQPQQRPYPPPPPQATAASAPSAVAASPETAGASPATPSQQTAAGATPAEGPGQRSRRRRRRRGRRGAGSAATLMGAPGTPTPQAPESSEEGSAPIPGDDAESFDDGGDEAGGDDQVFEAMPALATDHEAPAEPAEPAAPQHSSSPAPAGDTLHDQGSAPPPDPGNGDTDPQ
jgi:hypothetical protein